MNWIAIIFAILTWILLGVVLIFLQRKIIIYKEDTGQILAIIKPIKSATQILYKDVNCIITGEDVELYSKDDKVYLKDDEGE